MRKLLAAVCGFGMLAGVASSKAAVYTRSSSWAADAAAGQARSGTPNWGQNAIWPDAWSYQQLKFSTADTSFALVAADNSTVVSNMRWNSTTTAGNFVNTIDSSPWSFDSWMQVGTANQTAMQSLYNSGGGGSAYMAANTWYVPSVAWTNTEGGAVNATVAGNLVFKWTNGSGSNGYYNHAIDAAYLKRTAAGALSLLQEFTPAKPTNTWNVDTVTVPVNNTWQIATGDSIILAVKGWVGESDYRAELNDSGTNISTTLVGHGTWAANGSGDWSTAANWSGGMPTAEADFTATPAFTHNPTVFTETPVTLGKIVFNNAAYSYAITGSVGATLTLQSATSAQVDVQAGTHKINLPLTLASNTTFSVANGATLKISNPMEIGTNVALTTTLTGTGNVVYESNVTLDAGASMALPGPTVIPALSLAPTSALDVKTNDLIVKNGSLSALNTALNNGSLMTSSAAADPNGRTTVGVAEASVVGVGASFAGTQVAAGDVLVKYTYYGDSNLDGKVDGTDYTRIDAGYGSTTLPKVWENGDFNHDGLIDGSDYSLIDGSFGAALTTLPASSIATPAASIAGPVSVPEPTSIGLLALGATTLLRRRRK